MFSQDATKFDDLFFRFSRLLSHLTKYVCIGSSGAYTSTHTPHAFDCTVVAFVIQFLQGECYSPVQWAQVHARDFHTFIAVCWLFRLNQKSWFSLYLPTLSLPSLHVFVLFVFCPYFLNRTTSRYLLYLFIFLWPALIHWFSHFLMQSE